ncbi:MAG: ABC transporter substrate-binding protein [Eubacterium sp.]|nr:ABC transporter substrate-binding protein [Eubacterium sp.]
MKKKIFVTLISALLLAGMLTACGGGSNDSGKTEYRALYSSDVTTLNYLNTTLTGDMGIPANTQEWLIQYDSTGHIKPALAEKWETSKDGKTWTFKLRKGVKWFNSAHEEMGEVKAQDFVNAAEYALKFDASAAYMFSAAKIKNAGAGSEALTDGTVKWEDVGIKAVDDYTLEFKLDAECPYFLSCLTYGCFAPASSDMLKQFGEWDKRADWKTEDWNKFSEALDGISYDKLWYCGAYYLSEYSAGEKYTMLKNADYFEADDVFIETITSTYNAEAATLSGEMYQRGELEEATITSTMAKSWSENDKTKDLFHPTRVVPDYSYFFTFQYDPKFDEKYEPENWKKAVNNENFRKSFFYGINRVGAKKISNENNAEALVLNTITPTNFVSAEGKDYTAQDVFKELAANKDGVDAYFNEEKAKDFAAKAKKELEASGAKLPIKVPMLYNPAVADWDSECTYIEKQLEGLLGTDYIDIIVEQGPTQSFLTNIRRSNKFAFMKCNYGCDYADPLTYADPFGKENSYGREYASQDASTKAIMDEYYAAIDKANKITDPNKIGERYEAFAKAEAILLEHAIVIPYGLDAGYTAAYLDPFQGSYAPYGVASLKYKGMHILETPLNTEQFNDKLKEWEKELTKEK